MPQLAVLLPKGSRDQLSPRAYGLLDHHLGRDTGSQPLRISEDKLCYCDILYVFCVLCFEVGTELFVLLRAAI